VLINQATVVAAGGFPYHIRQSGSYRLSSNLVVTDPKQNAIDIDVQNVNLDLDGFSIIGPVTCTGPLFGPVNSCVPSDISGGSGIVGGDNVFVFNGSVQGFERDGVEVNGRGDRIERVTATQNGETGISSQNGLVSHCEGSHNFLVGIEAGSAIDNIASFNAFNGLDATVAIGNMVQSNGSFGLTIDPSGIASQNVMIANGQDLQLWPRSPLAISGGNNNCTGTAC
jgi:hypothetical protein